MKNYVTYRIACTIQLLLFFFVAVLAIHPNMSSICLSTTVNQDVGTPPVHYNASICKPDVAALTFGIPDVYTLPTCVDTKESYDSLCRCIIAGDDSATNFNIGLPGDDCNPSYFKIPVIALVLITILNDGTIISIAYDNVKPSAVPEQWNLIRVCITAFILGAIACSSTLLMLFLGMDSGSGTSTDVLGSWFGLPPLSLKQLECLIYLKISLSDFLTVFSARTNGFFFTQMPGKLLLLAFCAATGLSTVFAATWPFSTDMEPISSAYVFFAWVYCLVFFLIQDIFKVLANIMLDNVFEVTTNAAKRDKKRVQLANRKMIDGERRQRGESMSAGGNSSRNFSHSSKNYSQMDMATALNRINTLTSELEQLKGVVMRHAGMDSNSTSEQKTPSTRKRSDKSYLSQKSRDAASTSRERSESKNW